MSLTYQNPLVYVDKADTTGIAARAVLLLTTPQPRLTLTTAVEGLPQIPRLVLPARVQEWHESYLREEEARLKEHAAAILPPDGPGPAWQTLLLSGSPIADILRTVSENSHDLVAKAVCPASNALESRLNLKLIRKCPCPVFMARPLHAIRRVAVAIAPALPPYDDPATAHAFNLRLANEARAIAEAHQAELHIIQGWSVPLESYLRSQSRGVDLGDYFTRVAAEMEASFHEFLALFNPGIPIHAHYEQGIPEQVILRVVEREALDLLVIGTVAKTDFTATLLGGTAENVLTELPCSALILKPPAQE